MNMTPLVNWMIDHFKIETLLGESQVENLRLWNRLQDMLNEGLEVARVGPMDERFDMYYYRDFCRIYLSEEGEMGVQEAGAEAEFSR